MRALCVCVCVQAAGWQFKHIMNVFWYCLRGSGILRWVKSQGVSWPFVLDCSPTPDQPREKAVLLCYRHTMWPCLRDTIHLFFLLFAFNLKSKPPLNFITSYLRIQLLEQLALFVAIWLRFFFLCAQRLCVKGLVNSNYNRIHSCGWSLCSCETLFIYIYLFFVWCCMYDTRLSKLKHFSLLFFSIQLKAEYLII